MKFVTTALVFGALFATSTLAAPSKRQLANVYTTCNQPNTVAFTFDDGPYIYSDEIVQFLGEQGVKATFFFNGNNFDCIYSQAAMNRVRNVYNNGHMIGSHTWSHSDLTTLSWDQIHDEMWRVEQALQRIIGVTPAFMRPPYGNYNDLVRQASAVRGQSIVNWDFDSGDSTGASPEQSKRDYADLIRRRPNTIIALNHETRQSTAEDVIRTVIPQLKNAGYNLVTVAGCLGMNPYQSVGQPQSGSWSC
ncbi:carbohydrate esterase family 4 protein [Moniliophthora roreri MCA 2997]|uniref:Carbohydrate esterase family 4 protein n=1 Tax=Moniliophthora roreri (strain MCA 2997) TaxID=1381753 RepID=V2XDG8_MONRO|nr:carbohydrate esterase family 4 protein [Moniliophthora roreri MCA 2997]